MTDTTRAQVEAMVDETLSVLKYADLDRRKLMALIRSYYDSDHDVANWTYLDWLYKESPAGEGYFAIAELDGEYVGMTGLVPFRFQHGGDTLEAFMALHVLVHEKARGRRLFSKLIDAISEFLVPRRCFLFGHPNAAAIKSWERSNMQFTAGYGLCIVAPTRLGRPRPTDVLKRASDLSRFDFSELQRWQSDVGQPVLAVDAEFLRWRYFSHPTQRYRVELVAPGGRITDYCVRRRFRYPRLEFVVDWQGDRFWRRGVPGRRTHASLIGWPQGESGAYPRRPIAIQPAPRVDKEYPFFCTAMGVEEPPTDWDLLTFAITDFF